MRLTIPKKMVGYLWRIFLIIATVLVLALSFLAVTSPLPNTKVVIAVPKQIRFAGSIPAMPWPETGEAAVSVPGIGFTEQSPIQTPVPIASVTKMMTAYIILKDHPLTPGATGPELRMTQQDAYRFGTDTSFDESSVFVAPGELLSEYQLLEALLVPSANNIAWTLARWDSGSVARFVVKMNAWARELGMNSTHYAGPSGFNPASVSTPADQLKLAAVVMANPVFRSIVNMQSVNLPIAGVVSNYNPLLGIDGIVGVKSGFTPQANGCLVAAADTSVGGVQETAMAAAFGQPGWLPLRTAANADQALIDKLKASLETVHVIGKGAVVARMLVPWKSTPVLLHAGKEVSLVALPGMSVELSKSALLTHEGLTHEGVTHRKLEDIPTLHVGLGEQEYSLSLYDNHPLTAPSFLWRLNRFW